MDALDFKRAFWNYKSWIIPDTDLEIEGFSRSAYRTGFYIKAWNMLLDAGPQHFSRPDIVFITHTHGDHIAELPFSMIAPAGDAKLKPSMIYGPAEAQPFIEDYIDKLFTTNSMTPQLPRHEIDNFYRYNGLVPKNVFKLAIGKNNSTVLSVEVFGCDHRVPTVSYGFSICRQKLKQNYKDLEGREIADLRKQGVEVTELQITKKFAYVCDTSIKVFEMNLTLLQYPVIFIECTFLTDDDAEMAADKTHIHWKELEPYVLANPKTIFMLFHFSQRYKDSEIIEIFKQKNLQNVHLWVRDSTN